MGVHACVRVCVCEVVVVAAERKRDGTEVHRTAASLCAVGRWLVPTSQKRDCMRPEAV